MELKSNSRFILPDTYQGQVTSVSKINNQVTVKLTKRIKNPKILYNLKCCSIWKDNMSIKGN